MPTVTAVIQNSGVLILNLAIDHLPVTPKFLCVLKDTPRRHWITYSIPKCVCNILY